MVDVRELVVRISAIDQATSVLQRLNNVITRTTDTIDININAGNSFSSIQRSVDDAFTGVADTIDSVNDSVYGVIDTVDELSTTATDSINQINEPINDVNTSFNSMAETASNVASGIAEAMSRAASSVKGVADSINSAIDNIKVGQMAFGAVISVGTHQVFKDVWDDIALTEQYSGEMLYKVQQWVSQAKLVSQQSRAEYLVSLTNKGMDVETAMSFGETVEKLRFSKIATFKGQSVESMVEELNRIAGAVNISGNDVKIPYRLSNAFKKYGLHVPTKEEIAQAKEAAQQSAEWRRIEESSMSASEKKREQNRLIMIEAMKKQVSTMKEVDWAHMSSAQKVEVLKNRLQDLQEEISANVVPVLVTFVDWITSLIRFINSIPGATKFIAYVSVFTILGLALARLINAFNQIALSVNRATASIAVYDAVLRGEAIPTEASSKVPKGLQGPLRGLGDFLKEAGIIGRYRQQPGGMPVPLQDRGLIDRMKSAFGTTMATAGPSPIAKLLAVPKAAFASLTTGFSGIGRAVHAVIKAVVSFGNVLRVVVMAHPLGALLTIILTITAAVLTLAWKFGYLQRAIDKFKESKIGKDLIHTFYWLKYQIHLVAVAVGILWEKLMSFGGNQIIRFLDWLAATVGGLFESIDETYGKIREGGVVKFVISGIVDLFKGAVMMSPLGVIIKALGYILSAILNVLGAFKPINDALTWFKGWLNRLWSLIESLPSRIWKFIQRLPGMIWEFITKLPGMIWDKLKGLARDVAINLLEALVNIPGIGDWLKPTLERLKKEKELEEKGGTAGSAGAGAPAYNTNLPMYNSQYGITGWGASGFKDRFGVIQWSIDKWSIGRKISPDVMKQLTDAISDVTGGKSKNVLTGGQWKAFQEKYPELVKYMWGRTSVAIKPEEASMYGIPESVIPPKSVDINSLREQQNDWVPAAQSGGEVLSKGLLYVHEGEPIIPARISRSSTLINLLKSIAEGNQIINNNSTFVEGNTIDTVRMLSESNKTVNNSNNSVVYNITYNNTFHFPGVSSADNKTKRELINLIDDHMERKIRRRIGH